MNTTESPEERGAYPNYRTYPLYRVNGIELDVTTTTQYHPPQFTLRSDGRELSLPQLRGFHRYLAELDRQHTPEPHWSTTVRKTT